MFPLSLMFQRCNFYVSDEATLANSYQLDVPRPPKVSKARLFSEYYSTVLSQFFLYIFSSEMECDVVSYHVDSFNYLADEGSLSLQIISIIIVSRL